MFYGHFVIISSSLNVQAQFVAKQNYGSTYWVLIGSEENEVKPVSIIEKKAVVLD